MQDPTPGPDPASLWDQAERLLAARENAQAEAAYRRLTGVPRFAPLAHLRLSLLATAGGRHRDAVDAALAAYETRIPDPGVLELVATRLFALGETRAMFSCAMDVAVLRGSNVQVVADLGKLLANAYFPAEALQLLETARTRGFRNPVLQFLIGLCRMYNGEPGIAARELERSLERNPDFAPAHRALSKLRRPPAEGDGRIEQLRASLARLGEQHRDAPVLLYALFDELDRRERRDEAWQALEQGMRLRRAQVQYDSEAEQALFEHLGSLRVPAATGAAPPGPRPIFIVGMPRSGTTLLERMLGNHRDVADAGELQDFTRQLRWCADLAGPPYLDLELARRAESVDFAELGNRYLARTQWRAKGRAAYTDKMPPNFLNIAYIVRALPHARILHMVRGPMDTCFSNLKEWFAGAYPHTYDQAEMAEHFRRYRTLMAHWRAQYPDRILDVRYDELVADPEAVATVVLEFCGLPPHPGISAIETRAGSAATASASQVLEPVHGRYRDHWRRYEDRLGPLRERLGALAY
ncbi:tetratricopeptide repeat-containing sulfotransferase family protein [Cognatiluteimonas lumbrici]|uniref:tetratricopeptide repeat-containing sulfotransferase family protein n=1 Tax=Cognatiluteimonas lumbrici TaxID=2559601 RepID=UPI00112E3825|nr:sulfotransferase [Luteimonas lumbrici]